MHGKDFAAFLRRGDHLLQLCAVHGNGLFAHDVFPRLQAGDGQLRVHVIGRADEHQRHIRPRQKRLQRIIGRKTVFARVFKLLRVHVIGGHNLRVRQLTHLVQVKMPHISETDNTGVNHTECLAFPRSFFSGDG